MTDKKDKKDNKINVDYLKSKGWAVTKGGYIPSELLDLPGYIPIPLQEALSMQRWLEESAKEGAVL